jgi:hypothetical protein
MTRVRQVWMTACLAVVGLCLQSCGSSNQDPPLYAEIRFEVTATEGGEASFSVDRIVVGDRTFVFPDGTVFTNSAPFTFFVENSPGPFYGSFSRVGDANITVRLFRQPSESFVSADSTSDTKDTAVVSFGGAVNPDAPLEDPMVRADLCAPAAGSGGVCDVTTTTSGTSQGFNGSIGDLSVSYLVNGTTPAIYLFRGASDTVSVVVASNSGVELIGRLFVNNVLKQVDSSSDDVVLRTDL